MNLQLISVIVPCYNQAQYLSEALESVLQQTYTNWECLIINDGSQDNTKEVAEEWQQSDSRFKHLYKENGGLSSARNYGIENSKGNYILLLDADDKYHSTFMEKGIRILLNNPKVGVITSWLQKFDDKNNFYHIYKTPGGNKASFLFDNLSIGTSLFRKECWLETGGYDEKMKKGYEDWEFYIRLTQKWNVEVIPEVLFYYRKHSDSMVKEAINKYDTEIRKYIFIKHKQFYIENYEMTINNLFNRIEDLKNNEFKRLNSREYKICKLVLKPLRKLKNIFSHKSVK